MIRLTKEANNLYKLYIGNNPQSIIYFSYEVPIGFIPDANIPSVCYIARNQWSSTTGQHLNMIDPDGSKRVENSEFNKLLEEALK